MKNFALALTALMITATAAPAYVQSGQLPQSPPATHEAPPSVSQDLDGAPLHDGSASDPGTGINRRAPENPGDGPTNPVPEPGTMILTSMGLIALGAAVRRRRR